MQNLNSKITELLEAEFPDGHFTISTNDDRHFAIKVVSNKFSDLNRLKQHQLVYGALQSLLNNDTIHALTLETKSHE